MDFLCNVTELHFMPLSSLDSTARCGWYWTLCAAFHAASVLITHILEDTQKFMESPPPPIPDITPYFPYVTKLPTPTGSTLGFEIVGRPTSLLLDLANTLDNKTQIVIKFALQNCTYSVLNLDMHPKSLPPRNFQEAGSWLPWSTCHQLN